MGGRPGSNGSARLYQITRDYLLNQKGLTNIVWLWNVQDFSNMANDLNSYDPGYNNWDVLTMDMYWSDGQGYTTAKYNAILNKAAGKPIGISECDDIPMPALLAQQSQWTFFMPWSELTFQHNTNSKIQQVYWSDRVLVLNEMPGWLGYQFPQNPPQQATYVQAEDYSNMNGVIVGSTNDTSGGYSVGSIDTWDWMTYNNIQISQSGNYVFGFRVASPSGGQLQLEQAGGGSVLGTVNVPATGGWQTWTTVYTTLYLSAGTHNLGIKANTGGWNFNWFSYNPE
ncbi:carbohydrate-binding protein [Catenovulum sediminis]|uniref:carbohydrate-binding protein n=1 Tax=Catenovulum sediminis TaxID=1740262 RepID=UPI00163D4AA9|nr:carbohydrate-binding protein [Catenovulum sediminis]